MPMLEEAIEAIRRGDKAKGRQILEQILETEEDNEEVWLWLSSVVDSDEDREICLENVLALNPDNTVAQKGLEALRSGTFNVHEITGEAIEPPEEEDLFAGTTFHDQFFGSLDEPDKEDEESEWPGQRPQAKPKKAAAPKNSPLNLRLILLGVFGLLVVCGLGSAAVYNFFLAGDNPVAPGNPAGQEEPVQAGEPETTPTEILTPEPTPTPTHTPFVLPTAKPTPEPTPTPTRVVSPTPVGG